MTIITIIIFTVYLIAMGVVMYGMVRLPEFSSERKGAQTSFSVVIPFRNEIDNLPQLLASLQKLKYPYDHFEIIFIDDASSDGSAQIIIEALADWEGVYQIIPNQKKSGSPKKNAISAAIAIAEHNWIITTDADCQVPITWLESYHNYIAAHNPIFLAAPVGYSASTRLPEQYQLLDGLSLQAVTMAGFRVRPPMLCNGANMGYLKKAFYEVKGFDGNNHLASGDDIFLLDKMRRVFPDRVHYLKSRKAIVITGVQTSWKGLIEQRVRWASKTTKQNNLTAKILGVIVFLANYWMIHSILWSVLHPSSFYYVLLYFVGKFIIDTLVLNRSASFFKVRIPWWSLLQNSFIYPFITVLVVIRSIWGGYLWKGRKF